MPLSILITDDSSMARKQLARSLPDGWDVEVSFANNGAECIQKVNAGKGDLIFLDLNMPIMDGYAVLEAIRASDLPTMAIVVSGDIQPEARQRVKRLGALDFIKKPIEHDTLVRVLKKYGILDELTGSSGPVKQPATNGSKEKKADGLAVEVDLMEAYTEVANVAMGRAGDLLARLLGVFFNLPVPKVARFPASSLPSLMRSRYRELPLSAIAQGFVGSGLAGEALLLIEDEMVPKIAAVIGENADTYEGGNLGLLVSMASIVVGASINSISEQLDVQFGHGLPQVLGQSLPVEQLFSADKLPQEEMLVIEIDYTVESHDIRCTLLLMFTQDSLDALDDRIGLYLE